MHQPTLDATRLPHLSLSLIYTYRCFPIIGNGGSRWSAIIGGSGASDDFTDAPGSPHTRDSCGALAAIGQYFGLRKRTGVVYCLLGRSSAPFLVPYPMLGDTYCPSEAAVEPSTYPQVSGALSNAGPFYLRTA